MPTTRLSIPVIHGHLEALLDSSPSPQAYAAVCHLHPRYGGNMHNSTVYRIAKAWTQAHASSVRFNFRGVGASTGSYSGGPGEVEDAQAVFDFLEKQQPRLPLFVSGFSFGARTALTLALSESRIQRVLAVGVGVDLFDMGFVAQLKKPVAFVQAEEDEFGKLENLQALASHIQAPNKLFVVPKASHLFVNHMHSLEEQLSQALHWLLGVEAKAPPLPP